MSLLKAMVFKLWAWMDTHKAEYLAHVANASAHHAKYTDSEAVVAVANADVYVKNTGDVIEPITDIPTLDLKCDNISKQEILNATKSGTTGSKNIANTMARYVGGYSETNQKWGCPFYVFNKARGTQSSPTNPNAGDRIGGFSFQHWYNTNWSVAAQMAGFMEGSREGKLMFTIVASSVDYDVCTFYKDKIAFHDVPLKDIKNHVDATLSGTPRIIELLIGTTPYYFKVYPTKT